MAELARDTVDAMPGLVVLEFGASWCGYCRGARATIDRVLARYPDANHLWIEDGPGKRLGRSFRVKLWPTVIVMRDGREVGRVVRPTREADVTDAFANVRPG